MGLFILHMEGAKIVTVLMPKICPWRIWEVFHIYPTLTRVMWNKINNVQTYLPYATMEQGKVTCRIDKNHVAVSREALKHLGRRSFLLRRLCLALRPCREARHPVTTKTRAYTDCD